MKKINKTRQKFALLTFKRAGGFTLVEMLVVISIIAILTSVLAGGYVNSQKNSRDAARKIQLKSISDVLNSFYADNNRYPYDSDVGSIKGINTIIDEEGELNDGKGVIYIKKMPKEMKSDLKKITYKVSDTGKSFWLFTNLENPEDKSCYRDPEGSEGCGSHYVVDKGCCYVITSSNIVFDKSLLKPAP